MLDKYDFHKAVLYLCPVAFREAVKQATKAIDRLIEASNILAGYLSRESIDPDIIGFAITRDDCLIIGSSQPKRNDAARSFRRFLILLIRKGQRQLSQCDAVLFPIVRKVQSKARSCCVNGRRDRCERQIKSAALGRVTSAV